MRMLVNPEFQRNLWLRFSPFTVAAMPVLLVLFIAATARFNAFQAEGLAYASFILYHLVVALWANYAAAHAFSEEVRDNTWDFQRMSSITPWQLTSGKLFGSTSYAWYFALALYGVFLFSHSQMTSAPMFGKAGEVSTAAPHMVHVAFFMLLAGLMGNATALLSSIMNITKKDYRGKAGKNAGGFSAFLSGLIVTGVVYFQFVIPALSEPDKFLSWAETGSFTWYGAGINAYLFSLLSLLYFSFWIVMASYRLVKKELLYKMTPAVWMAFTLGMLAYFLGFGPTTAEAYAGKFTVAYYFVLLLAYGCMLAEAADLPVYKRLLQNWRLKNVKGIAENTPRWTVSLIVALVLCLTASAGYALFPSEHSGYDAFSSMSVCLMFFVRDGTVIHLALLNKKIRDPFFRLALYYILAYIILPVLLYPLLETDQTWFYPTGTSLFPPSLEVLLLWAWIVWHSGRKDQPAVKQQPAGNEPGKQGLSEK